MGLLDGMNLAGGMDPQTALLLGLGSGLLGTVGQGRRATFGEAMSAGLMSGTQSMRQAIADRQRAEQLASDERMRARQMQVQDEQLANMRDDRRLRDTMRQRQEQFFQDRLAGQFLTSPESQAVSAYGPTEAAAAALPNLRPKVNLEAELGSAMRAGLLGYDKFLELTAKAQPQIDKINPTNYTPESVARFAQTGNFSALVPRDKKEVVNGVAYNPYTVADGAIDSLDPNKPFSLVNGQAVPNLPYQQYKLQEANAGSAKVNVPVNVKTGTTMWGDVAKGVGDQIAKSADAARAARVSIVSANQLMSALDSGDVIAGPGSGAKRLFYQAASQIGLGDPERLKQTSLALQAGAQLELSEARNNSGQGALTEGERVLIKRAAAGDLANMTVGEVRVVAQVIDRRNREVLRTHAELVQKVRNNPDSGPLADFMAVPEPAPYQPPKAQPMAPGVYRIGPGNTLTGN